MTLLIRRAAVAALFLLLLTPTPSATADRDSDARTSWHGWTTLRLDARAAAFFTGRVDMRLDRRGERQRLETQTSARFLGARIARSRTLSVIDTDRGRSRSYESYSPKRGRRYRFGDRAYTVEKLKPRGRFEDPAESWKVTTRAEFAYPVQDEGAPLPVLDYYGMLLCLARQPLDEPGDEVLMHVATSGGPRPYRVVVAERRVSSRTYEDLATGKRTTRRVRELRLRVVPADPDAGDEGFLRMEGETEIWVEADSKTPIEISGKVPRVPGRVRLRLAALG